jgi:NAD(P)-dependent dehydrogenase (short-subunit alcohol dehydrogenase family)
VRGKICLVTGATNGIGKAAARAIAAAGATLLVHGRDGAKGHATIDEIRTSTGNSDVHFLPADFASLDDVRALANEIQQRFGLLHVLINNAGLLTDERQVSRDGFELTFAVNHLAPFLLTNLLLDTLSAGAPARIATNSSSAMGGGRINFDDLQMETGFDGWTAYANTKLANVLFSNLLAEKISGTGVVSNSFCPGLIDTDLLTGNRDFGAAEIQRLRTRMRTPDDGAVTPVFLACAEEAGGMTGSFFMKSHGGGKKPLQLTWDVDVAQRFWDVSREYVTPWLRQ